MIDAETRIVCSPVDIVPVGRGEYRVASRLDGQVYLMDAGFVQVLAAASSLEHVETVSTALARSGWEDEGSMIEAINELHSRGLILDANELTKRFVSTSDATEGRQSHRLPIYITSHNRPGDLAKCLSSFEVASVIDDSDDVHSDRVRELAAGAGGAILQQREKQQLVHAILRSAPDELRESVEFAVFGRPHLGITTGAQRNVALLHGAGGMVLCIDEDTTSEGLPSPSDAGVLITSAHEADSARFYANETDCRAGVASVDLPIESLHRRLLGRSPAALAAETTVEAGVLETRDLPAFLAPDSRVRATTSGIWGDTGMRKPYAHLFVDGPTHRSVIRDEGQFENARSARMALLFPQRPVVGLNLRFVTPHMGLDVRSILPPFFPVGRNSDGHFAHVMALTMPSALLGYAGYAVAHFPNPPRSYGAAVLESVDAETPELLDSFLEFAAPDMPAVAPAATIDILGRTLLSMAELPGRSFREAVETAWSHTLSSYVNAIEIAAGRARDAVPTYRDSLESHIEAIQESTMSSTYAAPADILSRLTNADAGAPDSETISAAFSAFQTLVGEYGRLLIHWPAVFDAAVAAALARNGC